MRLAQLIILLILFFTSCKSEEEPQNYIEVDGRKYELGTSHVSYYDRLNDAGELNHFYQIQVFGKNYKVQFDSDGKFYSENGDDFYVFFSLESKQAVRLEKTFYKNKTLRTEKLVWSKSFWENNCKT
jgi:hypothetical protein